MRKEDKTIYFFAKVGNLKEKPYGGGEVGNRRTMALQKELGYKTYLISRYYNYKPKSLIVYIKMIIGDFISIIRLFMILLPKKRINSLVHISGFTGLYLPLEFLAVAISRCLGFRTVYEIRGGGIVGFYSKGNFVYKWLFKSAIRMADSVFSQGIENKELILSMGNSRFTYYPNFLEEGFIPPQCPTKDVDPVRLVYLGRLSPSKNISFILEVTNALHNANLNVELHIIGDGEDYPDYVEKNKEYVRERDLGGICYFHGKMQRDEIKKYLLMSTFFLFPSEEKREGQSNALTEAMACGCIPISTSQGFSRGIINNDELIEDRLSVELYSAKIIHFIQGEKVDKLSFEMYSRIKHNFTFSVVKDNIGNEYNRVFGEV